MEEMDFYNLIALCALFIVITIFVYLTWNYNYWCLMKVVQAPTITAVFGNTMCIFELKENMASLCKKLHDKYKGKSMYGFYYMRTPALLLREPELVKHALQTKSTCFKPFVCPNPNCDPLLAKSPLFTADNSWMLPVLTAKRVKLAFNSLRKTCVDFNAFVEETIRNNSNGVTEINLTEIMSKYAGDIVATVGFGSGHQNSVATPDAAIVASAMKNIFEPGKFNGYRQAVCLFAPWIARFLRLKLVSKNTDRLFRKTLHNVLKNQRKNGPAPNDYLHWLVEEANDRHEVDEEKLTEQLFAFCLECYMLSSTLANLTAFYLAWNQEVQDKVRKEIDEVLEDYDGDFGFDACNGLDYLEQVINETMRLNPPIGFICKQVTNNVDFEGSDGQSCCLEPGDLVFVSNLGIHTDPEVWSDPQTFDPDRFDEVKTQNRKKFTYLPQESSKSCVAQKFSMIMLKMMLTSLLRTYRLSPSSKTKMPPKMSTMTQINMPEKGLWVQLEHVKNSFGVNYRLFGGDMAHRIE